VTPLTQMSQPESRASARAHAEAGDNRARLGAQGMAPALYKRLVDRRWLWAWPIACAVCGCLDFSTLEQEPALPDDPPTVSALEPDPLDMVFIGFNPPQIQTFAITQVADINAEQELYGRVIIDFGSSTLEVVRTNDTIRPSQRQYSYALDPCSPTMQRVLESRRGQGPQTIFLHFIISDAPFLGVREGTTRIQQLLETNTTPTRPVARAEWKLRVEDIPVDACSF
jgi:hypothetical protein